MEIKYLYCLLCVVDDMEYLELYDASLEVEKITNKWYNDFRLSNFGAIITFVGVVRDED